MLAEDLRDEAGNVGSGEAVPGHREPSAIEPGNADVHAGGSELDRRIRIVVDGVGIGSIVARNRDHRRKDGGETRHRHVVRGRDQHDVAEVGKVGQLVEDAKIISPRRTETEVADLHPFLDGPAQAGHEDLAPSDQSRSHHLDAVEFALRRQRSDDAGARGAVAGFVDMGRPIFDDVVLLQPDRHIAGHVADGGVVGVDAGVDHRDLDAAARALAPRPLGGHRVERNDGGQQLEGAAQERRRVGRGGIRHRGALTPTDG